MWIRFSKKLIFKSSKSFFPMLIDPFPFSCYLMWFGCSWKGNNSTILWQLLLLAVHCVIKDLIFAEILNDISIPN